MRCSGFLALVSSILLTVSMQGQGQEIPSERKMGDVATFDLPGGALIDMVWIEPGVFMRGSPGDTLGSYDDEGPQHQVTISHGLWLGKYELTQEQWESVMGTRPWEGKTYVKAHPDYPAVYVSWEDVQSFISKLNEVEEMVLYRLPTEAEWEYACRGGTTTAWSFGEEARQLQHFAWYYDNAWKTEERYAHAVGGKRPNPWGVYDLHGNVLEWCWDWYEVYSQDSQIDPVGPSSGSTRVVRGGCFRYPAFYERSAFRSAASPGFRIHLIGARLVRQEPQ